MNEKHSEITSALLDGEVDAEVGQRFISEITGSERDELARFERYCLIGDAIRGESSVLAVSVSKRVHEALLDEPVVLAPPVKRTRPWVKPMAGVAVAASVAAAAVFLTPQLLTQPQVESESTQVAAVERPANKPLLVSVATSSTAEPEPTAAGRPRWQGLTPDLEDRLNRLVIEHHEFGGRTGINGPVPHIGLASYGTR